MIYYYSTYQSKVSNPTHMLHSNSWKYIILTCEDVQVLGSVKCSTVSQIPDLHIGDLGGLPWPFPNYWLMLLAITEIKKIKTSFLNKDKSRRWCVRCKLTPEIETCYKLRSHNVQIGISHDLICTHIPCMITSNLYLLEVNPQICIQLFKHYASQRDNVLVTITPL